MATVFVDGGAGRLRVEVRRSAAWKVAAVFFFFLSALAAYGASIPLRGDGREMRFTCDRIADQCELSRGGAPPRPADHWNLSNLASVDCTGRGSRGSYSYDLDLVFAHPPPMTPRYVTISDQTAVNGGGVDYRKAAEQIRAFLAGHGKTLDVGYRYHPNGVEILNAVFGLAMGLLFAVVTTLAAGSLEVVFDRTKGTAEVVRRRFLRSSLRESVSLSDFTEIDERRFKLEKNARPGTKQAFTIQLARRGAPPLVLHTGRGADVDLARIEQGLQAFFGAPVQVKDEGAT